MRKELIEFRGTQKLSIRGMADKLGVSKSYYEKIEYGERRPSYNFISKFAMVFPDENIEKIFFTQNTHDMCEPKGETHE